MEDLSKLSTEELQQLIEKLKKENKIIELNNLKKELIIAKLEEDSEN